MFSWKEILVIAVVAFIVVAVYNYAKKSVVLP